ncbi:MAG: YraN family protein [Spirochaetaceae bacterium]|nr:YraN family protein [Spirochaetaceae bacterium]
MWTKITGTDGENRAAKFLEQQGYTILERQWRSPVGEVDIIAKKADVLVFCEVKTWPRGDADSLEKAINSKKCQRIIDTAKHFLHENHGYENDFIRFDVLVLDVPNLPKVHHIENAFS